MKTKNYPSGRRSAFTLLLTLAIFASGLSVAEAAHRRHHKVVVVKPPHRHVVVKPAPAKRVHVVHRVAPKGAVHFVLGGEKHFFHAGVVYRHTANGYVVADRKLIVDLPGPHRIVVDAGVDYYVVGGTYYRKVPGGYVVVDRPKTVIVSR